MRTRIVRIGNSQGVRIPKPLLQQAGLSEDIEIVVRDGSLLIRAIASPRTGWDDRFAASAAEPDLLDPHVVSHFDAEEWRWE